MHVINLSASSHVAADENCGILVSVCVCECVWVVPVCVCLRSLDPTHMVRWLYTTYVLFAILVFLFLGWSFNHDFCIPKKHFEFDFVINKYSHWVL